MKPIYKALLLIGVSVILFVGVKSYLFVSELLGPDSYDLTLRGRSVLRETESV